MLKLRASKARIWSVCSGVLFAVIGAFSAGVVEDANAQDSGVMVSAKAPVFRAMSSNYVRSNGRVVDISENLAGITDDSFGGNGYLGGLAGSMARQNPSDTNEVIISCIRPDGLPEFGGTNGTCDTGDAVAAGDILLLRSSSSVPGDPADITVRVYRKTAGGDFFVAVGDFPTATVRAEGELQTGEFFLNSAFVSVAVLAANVIGFQAVECDAARGYESTDDLTCNFAPSIENCALTEQGFDATANMCVDCGMNETADDNGICQMPDDTQMPDPTTPTISVVMPDPTDPPDPNPNPTLSPTSSGGGDDETKDLRNILGIAGIGMFFATWAFSDDLDNYEFSPSFGYAVNESGYSANAGGRIDFRKGDWSAYWSAGQANASGEFDDFRYSSGGEYKTDFWQASFSESVQGETADYDFSLSADLQGGIWSLSPVYRMNARLNEGKSVSRNSLNLEGVLEYERWTIRQSAGFGWRRTEDFGDSARFRLEAVREF